MHTKTMRLDELGEVGRVQKKQKYKKYKRFRNILTYLLNQQLLEIGERSAQDTEEDDVSIVTWLTN